MEEVGIGGDISWRQRVVALGPGGPQGESLEITPTSGKVRIHTTQAGTRKYWDGADFTAGVTTLTTTVNGNVSEYILTATSAMRGLVITYEGWVNDDPLTTDDAQVFITQTSSAKLKFRG